MFRIKLASFVFLLSISMYSCATVSISGSFFPGEHVPIINYRINLKERLFYIVMADRYGGIYKFERKLSKKNKEIIILDFFFNHYKYRCSDYSGRNGMDKDGRNFGISPNVLFVNCLEGRLEQKSFDEYFETNIRDIEEFINTFQGITFQYRITKTYQENLVFYLRDLQKTYKFLHCYIGHIRNKKEFLSPCSLFESLPYLDREKIEPKLMEFYSSASQRYGRHSRGLFEAVEEAIQKKYLSKYEETLKKLKISKQTKERGE